MSDPTCRQTLAPHTPSCTAAPAALSSSSVFRIRDVAARLCEAQQVQVAPEGIADKVNAGTGTAGKLVNDPALYDRLSALAERLDQVSTRLDTGEGTVGQLLQDKQLYENMNGAASELRALIGDIRKDPKKYLNVKVSIF